MREPEAIRIKQAYLTGCEPSHLPQLRQETSRRRYERVVSLLKESNPTRVLDLGCGEGNLERLLASHRLEAGILIAADINRSHCLGVRETNSICRPDVVQLDAESLPFRPNSFDVIVATEIIEHVPNESKCLSELYRLQPERLILTVPGLRYPPFLQIVGSERLDLWLRAAFLRLPLAARAPLYWSLYWLRFLKGFLLPLFLINGILKTRRLPYYDYKFYHGNVPHRLYTSRHLVSELIRNGFEVESVGGVGFAPPLAQELEGAFEVAGFRGLARLLARLQAFLDDHMSRKPENSQNIVIVCSSKRRILAPQGR